MVENREKWTGAETYAEWVQNFVQIPVQMLMHSFVQNTVQSSVQKVVQMPVQRDFAGLDAEAMAAPAGRPVYRGCGTYLPCSSMGATYSWLLYRSLPWSYKKRWLAVIYKQVAPLELKRRAEFRADAFADEFAEGYAKTRAVSRADDDAELGADYCAVIM